MRATRGAVGEGNARVGANAGSGVAAVHAGESITVEGAAFTHAAELAKVHRDEGIFVKMHATTHAGDSARVHPRVVGIQGVSKAYLIWHVVVPVGFQGLD